MREIVFDTETTGLRPEQGERIIELGAVELINRVPSGKVFHHYIHPEDRAVGAGAFDVHGISNDMLKDKPKFSEIIDEWLDFIGQAQLVAHNAEFDVNFLNHEYARLDIAPIAPDRVIDTLALARRKHPMGGNSLDKLCLRYKIDNSNRTKHGALLDSELLAEVYIELLGGRQASLELSVDSQSRNDQTEIGGDGASGKKSDSERPQRAAPLKPRLDAEAIACHDNMIEEMGGISLWERYR